MHWFNKLIKEAIKQKKIILIYQMGKVGSSTVYNTLKTTKLANFVFHLHFLSEDIAIHKKFFKKNNRLPYNDYFYAGEAIQKFLNFSSVKFLLISLVREPISLIVSNMFQHLNLVKSDLYTNNILDREKIKIYLEAKLQNDLAYDFFDNWFDKELKKVFGIDVFEINFSKEKGYTIYNHNNFHLLIMQKEKLNDIGEEVISNFCSLSQKIIFANSNLRVNTDQGDIYKWVLKNLKLDAKVLKKIYARPLARNFYSSHDIDLFTKHWSK